LKDDKKEEEMEQKKTEERTPPPPEEEKLGTPASPKPPEPEKPAPPPAPRVYPRVSRMDETNHNKAHMMWDRENNKLRQMQVSYEGWCMCVAERVDFVARPPIGIYEDRLISREDRDKVMSGAKKMDEVDTFKLSKEDIRADKVWQMKLYKQGLLTNGKNNDLIELKHALEEKYNYDGPTLWDLTEDGTMQPKPIGQILKAQAAEMRANLKAFEEKEQQQV